MDHFVAVGWLVLALASIGCAEPERDAEPRALAPERCRAPRARVVKPPAAAPATLALAFTDAGALALFDAASGATVASAALEGAPRDLAHDAWTSSAVVFVADDEGQSGAVWRAPIAAGVVGPPAKVGWLDGLATLVPAPAGLVLFEESMGTRWRLWRADGQPSASIGGALPRSAWLEASAGAFTVRALAPATDDVPELELRAADATPTGLVEGPALALGPGDAGARAAWSGALECAWIASRAPAQPDALALRCVRPDGLVVAEATLTGVGLPVGASVEGVAALGAPEGALVAVLLANPSRVVIARALGDGAWTSVALAGDVRVDERALGRDLAAVAPSRVLAATSAGVFAIDVAGVDDATAPPAASLDAAFDGGALRGPIATIAP